MMTEQILKYPLAFLVALVATYGLIPVLIRIAPRVGYVDHPAERRVHSTPTPTGGGLAVFVGFHLACLIILFLPWQPFSASLDRDWWVRFAPLSAALLTLGLIDDRFPLTPLVKLCGQTAVAALSYHVGLRFGSILGTPLAPMLDFALTIIWILVFVNAFNLIDGMDGVATGLALIASLGLIAALTLGRQPGDVLVLLGLSGACLAFLRFNSHPAQIFLGDTGSMFLGYTLAAVSLSTALKGTVTTAIAVSLVAVGVPLFDTILAIWRRSVRTLIRGGDDGQARRGLMQGDLDHLHHRLARGGMSHRRTATALYLISGAFVLVGLLLMSFHSHTMGIALAAFVAGTYVLIRHLAAVELWDTGEAILRGIRRPPRKAYSVFVHPPLDVLMLSVVLWLALYLGHPTASLLELKDAWLRQVPFLVGVPFLCIVASLAYQRVWSRARISEYVLLGAAVIAGALLGGSIMHLSDGEAAMALVRELVIFIGLATPAATGLRAFRRVVQDAMAWVRRRKGNDPKTKNTLIYGAGYRATLFLRAKSYDTLEEQRDMRIVGALDDDPNLHGRMVHGCKVFGGIERLNAAIEEQRVEKILIAAQLTPDVERAILSVAETRGLSVTAWNVSLGGYTPSLWSTEAPALDEPDAMPPRSHGGPVDQIPPAPEHEPSRASEPSRP